MSSGFAVLNRHSCAPLFVYGQSAEVRAPGKKSNRSLAGGKRRLY